MLGASAGLLASLVLSVCVTLLVSRLLSATLLRGESSAFSLELPPYRRPRVGQVLVRSLLDKTVFVLGRAVTVAAPAGLLIYLMGNCTVGGTTLLAHGAAALDPLGRALGLDGMILREAESKLRANQERNVKNSTAYTMAVLFNCIAESESDLMVDPYLNALSSTA